MLRYRARMGRELCMNYNKIGKNKDKSERGPVSESKARRRRPMRLSSERGDETETREEAYGDPIPQNVSFLDKKSKVTPRII